MQRYALGIEYDGRQFSGWQIQPDRPTVQLAMEEAVSKMAGHSVRVHAAGRTDAGVHASGQVIHFDSSAPRPLSAWVRGVNSFLPQGIAVVWARAVDERFHARFLASARHYRYLVLNHPVRPALLAGKVGWAHQELDVGAMRAAADLLLGEHDFSSFRAAECQAPSPVKVMHAIRIRQDGHLICFDFSASAFLHHMVRNIMGALLHIGKGNQPAEWMTEVLGWRDRSLAPPTFMPDGLYLSGVSYPPEYELPSEPAPRYGLL